MKKLLILCMIFMLVVLCACEEKTPKTVNGEITETPIEETEQQPEELEYTFGVGEEDDVVDVYTEVDEALTNLITSDEYIAKTDEEKVSACQTLLDELYQKGEIKNLSYDEIEKYFTFEYKNGFAGGLSLTDQEEPIFKLK